MNASAVLAELTGSITLARQIPEYLEGGFHLGPVTFAIVATSRDGRSTFLRASSGIVAKLESEESLTQLVLMLHERALACSFQGTRLPLSAHAAVPVKSFPFAEFLRREIDPEHDLLLVIHANSDEPPAGARHDLLPALAQQLARLLLPLIVWHTRPEKLGERFERLTPREWSVLRGLYTEVSEKQLADELGLSPHTLHSHIKSIYRKTGVQGRLPLLGLLQSALRTLRTSTLHLGVDDSSAQASTMS
jgi:DNA-binding CsgD family transcriptional regulator